MILIATPNNQYQNFLNKKIYKQINSKMKRIDIKKDTQIHRKH